MLHGLGVFARAENSPDGSGAVLQPRTLAVPDRGEEPTLDRLR
jgi:hypothetical protein